ncbi:MAG: hypothetical protein U9N61_00960 [Euryarchaeota archaeon]|nr:hypothetical protein [Euryarchaeota archaeon]
MGKISTIVCILVILLSTGLVSGEGIAKYPYPNAYSHIGALQVNVDNVNIHPAANRCKFEGAMLVGDVASPLIPTGIGHCPISSDRIEYP